MKELQYVSQDKAMRAEYEARLKEINDFNSAMTNVRKQEREKAKAEKIESAKKMIADGLSSELVSQRKQKDYRIIMILSVTHTRGSASIYFLFLWIILWFALRKEYSL